MKEGQVVSAKPLIAERLNFPGPLLLTRAAFFEEKNGEEVQFSADRQNKVELMKKLADSGRLLPLPKSSKRSVFQSGQRYAPRPNGLGWKTSECT